MRTFKLYNSLSRTKEDFVPLNPDHVRLYACGPTVYNVAHIGNARMAVVFDLLSRVLRTLYPRVTYASNITDIDDKIMDAAKAQTRKCNRLWIGALRHWMHWESRSILRIRSSQKTSSPPTVASAQFLSDWKKSIKI